MQMDYADLNLNMETYTQLAMVHINKHIFYKRKCFVFIKFINYFQNYEIAHYSQNVIINVNKIFKGVNVKDTARQKN